MLMHPYSYVYRVINKNICFYKCLRVRQHQKVTVNWQYTSCNLGQIILSVWKKYKLFTFLKYHTSQKCLVNECIIIKTLFYCLTTPPPQKKNSLKNTRNGPESCCNSSQLFHRYRYSFIKTKLYTQWMNIVWAQSYS